MQQSSAASLSPHTGLLVFPLGTLPPVRLFAIAQSPSFLCVSVLVLSYGAYSCSGGVNLAGMWWWSVGVLCIEVVWKGGGAGFEPMTCSVEVLRFRASHQCCTEAMSEVGCNSSPILLGKLLDIIKLLCIECKFSDLGTIVILGRLESYTLRARAYCMFGLFRLVGTTPNPILTFVSSICA